MDKLAELKSKLVIPLDYEPTDDEFFEYAYDTHDRIPEEGDECIFFEYWEEISPKKLKIINDYIEEGTMSSQLFLQMLILTGEYLL